MLSESHEPSRGSTRQLASFAAGLKRNAIPDVVFSRIEDLFVDWFGSTLAGRTARAVQIVDRFALTMGPAGGEAEVLISGRRTTPYFAAMVNAAASHVVEQDDVHNGSVFHPATVVFPVALAMAQALGRSGEEMLIAAIAGYEVGVRAGEFLGRSHYRVFHTTGTVGTLAAAAAVGRLLDLNPTEMLNAFGSAGTQSAGLWEFLRDAADSKQLHAAHAAGAGLTSAWLAKEGFTGAQAIMEGTRGMGAGMSQDADPSRLADGLGARWATAETSFKFHAACRHTHPAADALLQVFQENHVTADDVVGVTALVHQGAIDVLGAVEEPVSVHQAKFSMGSVLGLIAYGGVADLAAFEGVMVRKDVASFRRKVKMVYDEEVDSAYPARWIGKIVVETTDGRRLTAKVEEPKGDPGNTLSRADITAKAVSLVRFGGAHDGSAAEELIERAWRIGEARRVGSMLSR